MSFLGSSVLLLFLELHLTMKERWWVVGLQPKMIVLLYRSQELFPDGTLSLNVSDGEKQCLDVIVSIKNAAYLKGNAKFALGIVTGNNKEYILAEKRDDNGDYSKGKRYSKIWYDTIRGTISDLFLSLFSR